MYQMFKKLLQALRFRRTLQNLAHRLPDGFWISFFDRRDYRARIATEETLPIAFVSKCNVAVDDTTRESFSKDEEVGNIPSIDRRESGI
ncbi:MAG: hypothetical protein DHS20C01_31210 [marine bacterium B5-7]|nr:MAG: hypothetical protein DHS20C01_31210 [marine bacterium B5-7]